MLVDPALVAPVLGGVDRDHERRPEAAREVVAGHRDEPVVAVDEVEVVAVAELDPGGEHVGVHPLDPGDELAEVAWAGSARAPGGSWTPAHGLLGRRLLAAAGQHVDLDPLLDELLGELADVTGEPALDQRRVLPGEDQDSVTRGPTVTPARSSVDEDRPARLRRGCRCRWRAPPRLLGLEQRAEAQVGRQVAHPGVGGRARSVWPRAGRRRGRSSARQG